MLDYEFRGVRRQPDDKYQGRKWLEHPLVNDAMLYVRLRSDTGLPHDDVRNDPDPAKFSPADACTSELHAFVLIVRKEDELGTHMWDAGVACRGMAPDPERALPHPRYPMDVFGRVVDLAALPDEDSVLAWTAEFRSAAERALNISFDALPTH